MSSIRVGLVSPHETARSSIWSFGKHQISLIDLFQMAVIRVKRAVKCKRIEGKMPRPRKLREVKVFQCLDAIQWPMF